MKNRHDLCHHCMYAITAIPINDCSNLKNSVAGADGQTEGRAQ